MVHGIVVRILLTVTNANTNDRNKPDRSHALSREDCVRTFCAPLKILTTRSSCRNQTQYFGIAHGMYEKNSSNLADNYFFVCMVSRFCWPIGSDDVSLGSRPLLFVSPINFHAIRPSIRSFLRRLSVHSCTRLPGVKT
mgnify:CR=1 FL=1